MAADERPAEGRYDPDEGDLRRVEGDSWPEDGADDNGDDNDKGNRELVVIGQLSRGWREEQEVKNGSVAVHGLGPGLHGLGPDVHGIGLGLHGLVGPGVRGLVLGVRGSGYYTAFHRHRFREGWNKTKASLPAL